MLISDRVLDRILDHREKNYSEDKTTINRPKLKFHKLFGDKRVTPVEVTQSPFKKTQDRAANQQEPRDQREIRLEFRRLR
jgi:hypothetical protein